MLSVAASVPTASGVKITPMVQLFPAGERGWTDLAQAELGFISRGDRQRDRANPHRFAAVVFQGHNHLGRYTDNDVAEVEAGWGHADGCRHGQREALDCGEPTPFDAINQKVNTPLTVGVPLSVDCGTGRHPDFRHTKQRVFSTAGGSWNQGFWHT
jgi:hypothetical protein